MSKGLLVVVFGHPSIHGIIEAEISFALFFETEDGTMACYDVNNCDVEKLLADIKSGEIAIPEMQRPFVWDASKVRDLLDSLYKGFPIGYIIVWKNPDVKLKDGTTSAGKKILIDGQQRITALSAAIAGKEVLNSHYKWKRIIIAFNPLEEKFEVANSANQKSSKWIPDISKVFQVSFAPYTFVGEYCEKNGIETEEAKSRINDVIMKLIGIKVNRLGIIDLKEDLDIDSVTEIFIRINSKGVVLSQADFVMSKISSNEEFGGNLTRKTIDYFCHLLETPEDLKDIQNHDQDFVVKPEFRAIRWAADLKNPVYRMSYTDVLRVAFTYQFQRGKLADLVSLLSGRDFETREYKLDIEEESFRKLHEAVLETVHQTHYERFLKILATTGLIQSTLVRSRNVLNFGYALYLGLREQKVMESQIEGIVRRWVILSILTGRYSSSPESMFDYDIKKFFYYDNPEEYLRLTEAGELSDAFWNVTLLQKLDTAAVNSPYFNLFLAAQVKKHDKGFLSGHDEVENLLDTRGDIHHLFPKKYLAANGLSKNMYNQIANYALTSQPINLQISDDAPYVYMEKVLNQCETKTLAIGDITDKEILAENLRQHCIPSGFEIMNVQDYPLFLQKRRELMAQKIRRYYESL